MVAPPSPAPQNPVAVAPSFPPHRLQAVAPAPMVERRQQDFSRLQNRPMPVSPSPMVVAEARVSRVEVARVPPMAVPKNFEPAPNAFQQPRVQALAPVSHGARVQQLNPLVGVSQPANPSGDARGGRGDSSHGRRSGERDGDRH